MSKLLPIFDPSYNIREVAKQLCLLEDHLVHPRKRCNDCITKHFLTAEALAEEAVTLDVQHGEKSLPELAETIRLLQHHLLRGADPRAVAQAVRKLRKSLFSIARSVSVVGPEPGTGHGTALALSNPEPYTASNTKKLLVPVAVAAGLYFLFSKSAQAAAKDFFFHSGEDE